MKVTNGQLILRRGVDACSGSGDRLVVAGSYQCLVTTVDPRLDQGPNNASSPLITVDTPPPPSSKGVWIVDSFSYWWCQFYE